MNVIITSSVAGSAPYIGIHGGDKTALWDIRLSLVPAFKDNSLRPIQRWYDRE